MDLVNELGLVFVFAASIGAAIGYVCGWNIAVRGGKTRYFQELAHRCALNGMTKNQFASLVGIQCGLSLGLLACVLDGMAWLFLGVITSQVVFACIASICSLNLFIGLYIGRRGPRWFVGIGPGAVLLLLGCLGVAWLLRYAQDHCGYHASPGQIAFTLAFGVFGWIGGRILRNRREE